MLLLNSIKLNLSFSLSAKGGLLAGDTPVAALIKFLSVSLGNLDRAPMCFNTLWSQHVFEDMNGLQGIVMGHYQRQVGFFLPFISFLLLSFPFP